MNMLPYYMARRRSVATSGGAGGGTDPHWANVVLQSQFTGPDGSTTFTDQSNSGHTITAEGVSNPQILNNKLELDGDDSLIVPDSVDWHFGTGPFTIEVLRAEFDVLTTIQVMISQYTNNADQKSWYLGFRGDLSPKKLIGYYSLTGLSDAVFQGTFSPLAAEPHDLTYERDGTTLRLYVDGVMVASTTEAGALFDSTSPLRIGRVSGLGGVSRFMDGRMRAVRITKGVARYATDTSYAVPSLPLPTS